MNKAFPDSGARGFTGGTEKLKQVQELAQRKLDKLREARLSFSIGEKTIVVRDVVRKTIGYVTTFKEVISTAISAEPGAGLAWAGIMSILPVRCLQYRTPPYRYPDLTTEASCCSLLKTLSNKKKMRPAA